MKKLLILIICLPVSSLAITKLFLDTNYKVNYINYSNLDFDSTVQDEYNHIYSNLNLSFKTQIDNLFFCTKLTSLGEWGQGGYKIEYSSSIIPTQLYKWQTQIPYPQTNFVPFIEEVYLKYEYLFERIRLPYVKKKIENIKFGIILGRQEIELVNGFVVGNNGIGYDAINFLFSIDEYLYGQSFISKILTDTGKKNFFLCGLMVASKYFPEFDFGVSNVLEQNDFFNETKLFTEFFIKRTQEKMYYVFEYAMQQGKKNVNDVVYNGSLWYFKAGTKGENKFLGKSYADIVWLLTSGGDEGQIFSPSFYKRYDGLEPYGIGEFAAAGPTNLFFDFPTGYSGMFVLGLSVTVSPWKNFSGGLNYYLYSSAEGPPDKPEPSSTEKTLGAKKAIGIEYGINLKYNFSKYTNIKFSYSLFNPLPNIYPDYPKGDTATKIKLATEINF